MDLLEGDVELTEFEAMEVQMVKGVRQGASGFPILLMKGVDEPEPVVKASAEPHAPFTGDHAHPHPAFGGPDGDGDAVHEHQHTHDGDNDHHHEHEEAPEAAKSARDIAVKAVTGGQIDEKPDVAVGQQVMRLLGQAIANEAEEISAGAYGETRDVAMLGRAADIVSCWIAREQAVADGQDPNAPCGCCPYCQGMGCGCCQSCGAGALMCSVAEEAEKSSAEINDLPDSAFAYIEPGGKKDDDGKTTPRSKRHFPVHDEKHARLAVQMLSTSEFGGKAKSKVLAAAKKYGIDTDASKSVVANEEADVDTEVVAKAVEPLLERITALEARDEAREQELAKAKATLDEWSKKPLPGGPVTSAVRLAPGAGPGSEDWAAKAAYYREKAELATDPADREGYRQLARDADTKATG